MATEAKKTTEVAEEERRPLLEVVRKVLLAGIGAVALAQDEMEDFVNRLIERGEIAEKDGRKLIRDLTERREKETARAEQELDDRVGRLVNRLGIPSKSDIDALSDKIAALDKKVDGLKKA